ncbi:MAG TPA: acyl-CoA synthetase [Actinomycetota bacterium]|jgi:malonyl-CoA/methylmalonyl-CoA synthetase|nr:acyl-CoA synthetase [Actinomycetota bacterium]
MGESLALVDRAQGNAARIAVIDRSGRFTYERLLADSRSVATALLGGEPDLREARVAHLCWPGYRYVATQWGIWRAGGIAVPLAVSHPEAELEHCVSHSGASVIVADPDLWPRVEGIARSRGLRLATTEQIAAAPVDQALPAVGAGRRAVIFYTSGTTGRPKGAVWAHRTVQAQVSTLTEAWGWTGADRILSVLPLHHVHGVINVLTTALWNGARCELLRRFDPLATWRRLASGDITVFMAVPTIYVKLIRAWEEAAPDQRRAMSDACRGLRLMVSGSAALPVDVFERWREVSGQTLLERYGMTEIGIALSNPLAGERVPGAVGRPLAGVGVRLVDETGATVADGAPGELEVRGPGVFLEYWNDHAATRAAFRDGWFRTGDVAVAQDGIYRILGRQSVDIIKTGGFKVSALEIEDALLANPEIDECAVVGLPDPQWGERVTATIVARDGARLTADLVRQWAGERLAPYKVPSRVHFVDALPRNALGKVVKTELRSALPD